MTTDLLSVRDAVELAADPLDSSGLPRMPCTAVVLDGRVNERDAAVLATLARSQVVVGVLRGQPQPDVVASLTLCLGGTSPTTVDAPLEPIAARVGANPRAATALAQLLRITSALPVLDGVVAESLAYSMLLGGPEFARWRYSLLRTADHVVVAEPVLIRRDEDELTITLNQPARHNAFSASVRDGLIDALAVAADPTIRRIHLQGAGRSFCSGGDLDEFGTSLDLAAAHALRVARSSGLAVHAVADRVEAHLHGACIGAGIEVPAFASRVTAAPDARIALPELAMGLVPGAGGTVSVTRRIGRWRTAWMVLSGEAMDPATALSWGLVDAIDQH